MAVKIDILGSCVCRDIFRDVDERKYKICRRIGNIPVTSLYEEQVPVKKSEIDALALTAFEKQMLKIQLSRKAVDLLKNSEATVLIMDLADELMERWKISDTYVLAVPNGKEKIRDLLSGIYGEKIDKFFPMGTALQKIEDQIKNFVKDITQSEENPEGFKEENIIVIESYCAPDILTNDANLRSHKKEFNVKSCNEWLSHLYSIFYKYCPNCKVIKLPEFTHSSENHIRGVHPLHYMQNTYEYFLKAIDVLCGFSKVNTLNNLYKEESLKNRLETRAARSGGVYQINDILRKLEKLENDSYSLPVNVDIFGSCVCRDIFRFSFPGRYKVQKNIERIPISCLFQDNVQLEVPYSNYEERMLFTLFQGNVAEQLKASSSEILVLDLAEERLDRIEIQINTHKLLISKWPKMNSYLKLLKNFYKDNFQILREISYTDITEEYFEQKCKKFADEIIQTDNNPEGYSADKIYIIESLYADKIVDNKGFIRDFVGNFTVKEHNEWLKKRYSILYKYFPKSKIIKIPPYTCASSNHRWGGHPLHYTDNAYHYLADVIDYLNGMSEKNIPANLYKEEMLQNILYRRLLNAFSENSL